MAKPRSRNYSPVAREAAALIGAMIRTARLNRKMTLAELAERTGVARGLVARVENGDMGSAIGAVFEMAAVLGVPLFEAEPTRLTERLDQAKSVNALMPKRAFQSAVKVDDDF